MARLESEGKMGFYPTPKKSLGYIKYFLLFYASDCTKNIHLLDPCCGEGEALDFFICPMGVRWGIELDPVRAEKASKTLDHVIQCSIFDARVNPLGRMGLLWLNPPYSSDEGERTEMKFLKHAIKWLATDGVLVFIVPEVIFEKESNRRWISEHFKDIRVFRLSVEDYPRFKQVVLFGVKRSERVEDPEEVFSPPPYQHIEVSNISPYIVPVTDGPTIFQAGDGVTEEDVRKNRENVLKKLKEIGFLQDTESLTIRPIFPLRKGHLVSLITCGVINGKVEIGDNFLVIKGFSDRVETVRETDKEKIITNTYRVGIRVMGPDGWYDVT
ncbi:MAG: DUF6094 domain-containing protein [Thermodesulfovibrionales bacterium]